MIATGEKLSSALREAWFSLWPHIPMVNAYGPTECSDDVTHAFLSAESNERQEGRVPIGLPVSNTAIIIADAFGYMAPSLARGEIQVAGAGSLPGLLARSKKDSGGFRAIHCKDG